MLNQLQLRIDGLDCPCCATDTASVLLQLEGILNVKVGYSNETIAVEYNPEVTDTGQIISALKRIGFRANIV